jgi:hypothetical protein
MKAIKLMAVLAIFAATSMTWADCGSCGDKECSGETCASSCCEEALAMFPKMTYRVSEHETCCADAAAKLAADHDGESIKFVVAEKVYEDKAEAMTALAEVAEKFVADFSEPHTCQVSGTTSIAGKSLKCSDTAGKMASTIKEAIKTVSMTYKVGDETCSCPTKAAEMAKEAGTHQHFVVGGEETCCNIDARVKLAAAKYKAALEALASLEAPAEETAAAGTES